MELKAFNLEDLFPLEALEYVEKEKEPFAFRAVRRVSRKLGLSKRAQRSLRSYLVLSKFSKLREVESPWVLVTINGKKFLARTKSSLEKERELEEKIL